MNATNLKKMNTEKMHRLYTKLTGNVLFNPYEERGYMIVIIATKLGMIEEKPVQKVEAKKVKQTGHMYEYEENQFGVKVLKPVLGKLETWWNENGNPFAPMPEKGRIPSFSYTEAKHILFLDSIGTDVKEIAKTFKTSYQQIYAILTGKSYNWVMVTA